MASGRRSQQQDLLEPFTSPNRFFGKAFRSHDMSRVQRSSSSAADESRVDHSGDGAGDESSPSTEVHRTDEQEVKDLEFEVQALDKELAERAGAKKEGEME